MATPLGVPTASTGAGANVDAVIDNVRFPSMYRGDQPDFIGKLETQFSEAIGVKHCICVNSGTAALQLAMAALGVGPGDEVIVPTFAMMKTVSAIFNSGATPVFVDCDERNWCVDAHLVEQAVTDRTKVILPVHIYGHPADMDPINRIATENNIRVVEDATDALGTCYKGRRAGGLGDISCFGFYDDNVTAFGEGGLLATNNPHWARRVVMLRDQGFKDLNYHHSEIGYHFRMNNLTAAYIFEKLEKVDEHTYRRRRNVELCNRGLADIGGIILPPEESYGRNSFWKYGILIDAPRFGRSKTEVRQILSETHQVLTRDFLCPMHLLPVSIDRGSTNPEVSFPVSEKLWNDGFYLPFIGYLKEAQIEHLVTSLQMIKEGGF